MSDLQNANAEAPVSPPPLRTWDFLETTLVVLIADGVFNLAAGFAMALALSVYGGTRTLSPVEFQALWLEGRWQGVGIIAAALPTIAVLWVAIRMAGREFAEYLALNWPSGRELLRALGITAIVVLAESFVAYFVGAQGPATISDLEPADRFLHCRSDRRRVRRPRLHVSRLVTVISWSDWSHRDDVGGMGDESHSI
jgi:hypothetical protein